MGYCGGTKEGSLPSLGECYSLGAGDSKDLTEKIEFKQICEGRGGFKSRFLSRQKGRMVL